MKRETKKFFEAPTAEIIALATECIMTTSPGQGGGGVTTPGENEGPFVPA